MSSYLNWGDGGTDIVTPQHLGHRSVMPQHPGQRSVRPQHPGHAGLGHTRAHTSTLRERVCVPP